MRAESRVRGLESEICDLRQQLRSEEDEVGRAQVQLRNARSTV